MNLAHRLALLVSQRLQLRARSEKPGLLARASSLTISDVDWQEAYLCGRAAVSAAVRGESSKMVTLLRDPNAEYSVILSLADLDKVAFVERTFPEYWVNAERNDILPGFADYALPLIGAIPSHPKLP